MTGGICNCAWENIVRGVTDVFMHIFAAFTFIIDVQFNEWKIKGVLHLNIYIRKSD